jgi:hypothetical protein
MIRTADGNPYFRERKLGAVNQNKFTKNVLADFTSLPTPE